MGTITFDKVSKTFSGKTEVRALDGISLTVDEGEFVALLGPSGCGKSTLLNLLAGFESTTEGRLHFDGKAVTRPGPDRGVVFQEAALFPWLNVWQNVVFGPQVQGIARPDYEAKARNLIKLVGLEAFADALPVQLSGGMRQRVGIARALGVRPAILLMDEPLSALDSQTRELLLEDFIRLLADGAMGAVYVTHNLEEAVRIADRIVVLSRRPGKVRETVAIPMTRAERGAIEARGRLLALQNELWSLIREQAIDAEREVQHA
jgi:NitT/TauT family transport system ATP-binding protein